jgi:hypothetical protein
MTMLYAAGGMILVTLALIFTHWALLLEGRKQGRELARIEQAERRALRRAGARQGELATAGRHRLQPFPGDADRERLAETDQLRKLAEQGDVAEIRRLNAAWFRVRDLKRWAKVSA